MSYLLIIRCDQTSLSADLPRPERGTAARRRLRMGSEGSGKGVCREMLREKSKAEGENRRCTQKKSTDHVPDAPLRNVDGTWSDTNCPLLITG